MALTSSHHPDTAILSEDELSSVASDTAGFINLSAQTETALQAYQAESEDDMTNAVLSAALKYLPMAGRINMMEEIVQFDGDQRKHRQLAMFFIDSILKPMRLCHAPEFITTSPTPQAALEIEGIMALIESSTRGDQAALKKLCLRRDGSCCVISNHADKREVNYGHLDQGDRDVVSTQCAHIIPFALRECEDESALEIEKKATIWWSLYRYFPALNGLISAETINQPANAMTLGAEIHDSFGHMELALEPSHEQHNTYRVRQFARAMLRGLPSTVSFSTNDSAVPTPHQALLRAHFAVASILAVSGVGARINKYLEEVSWENVHGQTKSDGSTPLAELVKKKLLIGI